MNLGLHLPNCIWSVVHSRLLRKNLQTRSLDEPTDPIEVQNTLTLTCSAKMVFAPPFAANGTPLSWHLTIRVRKKTHQNKLDGWKLDKWALASGSTFCNSSFPWQYAWIRWPSKSTSTSNNAWMWILLYPQMYLNKHVYTHVNRYLCIERSVYLYIFVSKYLCMYVHTYVCTFLFPIFITYLSFYLTI